MESDLPLLYHEFQKAANTFSQNIAVIYNDGKEHIEAITYQKLVQEVLKVSQCLERVGLVMQSRQFVCLFMEPEICLPALIMGILSKNAAFICLDNRSTAEQRKKIFCELNMFWVFSIKTQDILSLTNLNQIAEMKQEIVVNGIVVELWQIQGAETELNYYRSSMAYAIMTSGTCGVPKCVQVPHGCITPNIMELRSILNICSNDIIFMASPLTFDPCIVELFMALTSGAAILIVSHAIKAAPSILIQVLFPKLPCIYSGITIMQCTPSVISRWPVDTLRDVVLGAESSLKALLLGGEPCPNIDALKSWKSRNNRTNVYNIYGITEVSCWASLHKIDFSNPGPNGVIPLGVPLQETSLQIRDEAGTVVSDGLGELFIGSATRVCIIDNENDSHQSLPFYRATGDIVKIDKKRNEIIYSYRKDDVIKRWGHRTNLSQIENLAAQNDFVKSSHCVWDRKINKLGLFINFLKRDEDIEKCLLQIRLNLGENLAYFSIPDLFLHISEVPLTAHGKVDKRKLLALMNDEIDGEQKKLKQDCDHTDIQAAFQDLCQKYLCCSSIIPNKSFLAQGGNSFLALAISNDLEKSGYTLPRTFILKLLDGSTFQECYENLKSLPLMSKDSDISIVRKMQKDKTEDTVSEETKDIKRFKRTMAEDDDLAAACRAGVHYSMCRGRLYKYGTPVDAVTIATRVNDLASVGLEIAWAIDLGKCIDASPLFIQYSSNESRVIVGSHSHNLAIIEMGQTADTVLSQFIELNDRIESSACVSTCGRYVFVGCYGGYIYCTDTRSGKIHWKFNTESCVKCSPALCLNGSAIVVGSYNSILYCIRILDGKQLWSIRLGSSGIVSSPCVSQDNHMIFVGSLDGTYCSINEEDAAVIWRAQLSSPIFSNPTLINGEKQVLFAEVTGLVHCMSSLQGDKLWTFQASGNIFSAFSVFSEKVEEDQIVFGCHDKNVYCLKPDNGNSIRLKWKSELDSAVYATPFVFAVKAITGTSTNLVAAISTRGVIYLLDFATGTQHRQLALPGDVFSSPIVHKDKLIVGCRDNNVYGVRFFNGDSSLG